MDTQDSFFVRHEGWIIEVFEYLQINLTVYIFVFSYHFMRIQARINELDELIALYNFLCCQSHKNDSESIGFGDIMLSYHDDVVVIVASCNETGDNWLQVKLTNDQQTKLNVAVYNLCRNMNLEVEAHFDKLDDR